MQELARDLPPAAVSPSRGVSHSFFSTFAGFLCFFLFLFAGNVMEEKREITYTFGSFLGIFFFATHFSANPPPRLLHWQNSDGISTAMPRRDGPRKRLYIIQCRFGPRNFHSRRFRPTQRCGANMATGQESNGIEFFIMRSMGEGPPAPGAGANGRRRHHPDWCSSGPGAGGRVHFSFRLPSNSRPSGFGFSRAPNPCCRRSGPSQRRSSVEDLQASCSKRHLGIEKAALSPAKSMV